MVGRCHCFPCFHFLFFLYRSNNFRYGYGNYFKSAILKVTWYQLRSKFLLNNYEALSQQHLKDTLRMKILWTWINTRATTAGIYFLKVNNRSFRTRCEIRSKLTIKTTERRQAFFTPFSSLSIVNFEHVIAGWELYTHGVAIYYNVKLQQCIVIEKLFLKCR